jgi:hypothetical protein
LILILATHFSLYIANYIYNLRAQIPHPLLEKLNRHRTRESPLEDPHGIERASSLADGRWRDTDRGAKNMSKASTKLVLMGCQKEW